MTGIEEIAKERKKQISEEHKSAEFDVLVNSESQLLSAALLLPLAHFRKNNDEYCPEGWNLQEWRELCCKPQRERLILAGALLAAEIDRIDLINEARGKQTKG